jgi:hypothetical protein
MAEVVWGRRVVGRLECGKRKRNEWLREWESGRESSYRL